MRIFFLSTLFFLCAACGSETVQKSTDEADIGAVQQQGINLVPVSFFHQYLQQSDHSYTTDLYHVVQTVALEISVTDIIDSTAIKPFAHLLVYNSDSTKALDLFSGNYIMATKNSSPSAQRGEPDTELALIDFKNGMRSRILYVGPSYLLTDAVWINDSTIGVAGAEVIDEEAMVPMLWQLQLHNKTVVLYRYSDTLMVNMDVYYTKRYGRLLP